MIRVKNRPIIAMLAKKQFEANRSRNRLLVVAIVLATVMLTTVFSLGSSYSQALIERNVKLDGSRHDAVVLGATEKQLKEFKKLPNIKYAGVMVGCVTLTEFEGVGIETTLAWSDETNWEKQILPALEFFKGNYPQGEYDLVLSTKALKKMGVISPKVGMILPVTYVSDTGYHQQTFTLTGYFNDYSNKNRGFVSTTFFNTINTPISDLNKGRLLLTFRNPVISEKEIDKLKTQVGLKAPQAIFADTEMLDYLRKMIFVVVSLVLLIMTSAYLLIYNILYISVNKEIRFYGLLKTIGTTTKQLKRLIFIQMLRVSLVGIPLGLVLGSLISFTVIPALINAVSVYPLNVAQTLNPFIFIGSGLFSFLTVYLSTRKPAKLAGEISPIEAVSYTGLSNKKGHQRGKNGAKIIRMAWRNMFRDKKRAVIVFLSLFVGLTAFLTVTTLLDSNRADRVLDKLTTFDINLRNKTSGEEQVSQKFDLIFLEELEKLHGIKEIHLITATNGIVPLQKDVFGDYIVAMYKTMMNEPYEESIKRLENRPEEFMSVVVGIDDRQFNEMKSENNFNVTKEEFLSGKVGILRTYRHSNNALKDKIGSSFNLIVNNQDLKIRIGGTTMSRNAPAARYSGFYPEVIVSEKIVKKMIEDPIVDNIEIVYEQAYNRVLEREIGALVKEDKEIDTESKIERYDNMKDSEKQLSIFGYTLAIVLAILGIMNYVNLMTTSIITRSREFATLQSIGMTRKQLRKLLMTEGLGYGVLSILFVLSIGTSIAYVIFQATNSNQLNFIVPFWPITITFLIVLSLCMIVPILVFTLNQTGSVIYQLTKSDS